MRISNPRWYRVNSRRYSPDGNYLDSYCVPKEASADRPPSLTYKRRGRPSTQGGNPDETTPRRPTNRRARRLEPYCQAEP
jgi:hypothetical protein